MCERVKEIVVVVVVARHSQVKIPKERANKLEVLPMHTCIMIWYLPYPYSDK